MNAISECVAKGAELLDKNVPDWYKPDRINIVALDLRDPCLCVVGQVFVSYDSGVDMLITGFKSAYDYGFDAMFDDDWEPLTEAWLDEINTRRWEDSTP